MANRWSRQYYLDIVQDGTNRQEGFQYLDAEVTNIYSYLNALNSEALSPSTVVDIPLPNRVLLLDSNAQYPSSVMKPTMSTWDVDGRPESPYVGQYGYNSDLDVIECWSGSKWGRISGEPRGKIALWSGEANNTPVSWVLCDGDTYDHPEGGQFTTPNLCSRFIVGAGTDYAVSATGGEATHVLTVAEEPSHRHRLMSSTGPGNPAWITNASTTSICGDQSSAGWSDTAGNGAQLVENTGGGAAHNNLPPYYALCYIYKM